MKEFIWFFSACFVDYKGYTFFFLEWPTCFLGRDYLQISLILHSINESHLLCCTMLIMVEDNNEEGQYLKYVGVLLRIFLPTSVVLIFTCVCMHA